MQKTAAQKPKGPEYKKAMNLANGKTASGADAGNATGNENWLSAYRQKNREIFESRPVKKSKYTSITKLEEMLKGAQAKALQQVPELSGAKVAVMGFAQALEEMPRLLEEIFSREERAKDQFEAFVNANFATGFVVVLGKECEGKTVEAGLKLRQGVCAKGIFIFEKGVNATVFARVFGAEGALYSETVFVQDGASAGLVRMHSAQGKMITYQQCILGKDARFANGNAWLAGELVRANTTNILDGQGSRAEDYSLLLAAGAEQFDINYSSVHRAPDTFSHSIFNSALKDRSRAVYDGMIRIEEGGSRTNALLETHSMILGKEASSNQIPQLEIMTDDVKATHSATVAHIEEDELFYLQAKGIPREEAQRMVVKSFLESIVLKFPAGAQDAVAAEIEKKL